VRLLTIITVLLMGIASSALAAEDALRLTLKESIRMAVENNLDVRAELYNPAQFEADINRNRSIYDTIFNVETKYSQSLNAGRNFGDISSFLLNSSLTQLFWTGATATIFFDNSRS